MAPLVLGPGLASGGQAQQECGLSLTCVMGLSVGMGDSLKDQGAV